MASVAAFTLLSTLPMLPVFFWSASVAARWLRDQVALGGLVGTAGAPEMPTLSPHVAGAKTLNPQCATRDDACPACRLAGRFRVQGPPNF